MTSLETSEKDGQASPCIAVTNDGGVTKTIVREGRGSKPSLHATCLVHYIGQINSNEHPFIDTRSEGDPVKLIAGRDSLLRNVGLNLAVATMRAGEVASIRVQPEYGYGTQGSFSFPSVPPNSCLTYELELLQFDPVAEGKASCNMLFEERLEAAERRRIDGNELFKAGSTTEALGKYAMALSYMDQDFMFQLQGPHEDKANAVRLPILLNMAACHLQLSDYKGAIEASSQVISAHSNNAKALFRRGKAYHLSRQTEAALVDLEAARKLMPNDSAVKKEIQAVRRTLAAEKMVSDNLFRGRLPSPKPAAKAAASTWKRLWLLVQQTLQSFWHWLSDKQHAH